MLPSTTDSSLLTFEDLAANSNVIFPVNQFFLMVVEFIMLYF